MSNKSQVQSPESMVKVRYWCQETVESGRWCLTDFMTEDSARKIINGNILDRAEIVFDE